MLKGRSGHRCCSQGVQLPNNQNLYCFSDLSVLNEVLLQMAKNNIGSLLVFDESKLNTSGDAPPITSVDACVGIVTERGKACPQYFYFSLGPCST